MRPILVLAAVFACSPHVIAATIQDARYITQVTYSDTETSAYQDVRIGAAGTSSVPGASETITVGTRPVLFASAAGIDPVSDLSVVLASAEIDYYFVVTGPQPGLLVPLFIDYDLSASASGQGSGDSEIDFADDALNLISSDYVDCNLITGCLDKQGNVTSQVSRSFQPVVTTGDSYLIVLNVEATSNATGDSGTGYADPYIHVDPNFAGAQNYSVDVSAGVGNSPLSSTPEPASWLLVGLPAALLWRRKKRNWQSLQR